LNVTWLQHLPAPIRRRLYFGLQSAIGSRLGEAWRAFRAWTTLSPEALSAKVEARLSEILATALATSAYYRSLGLTRRSGESAREFLSRFPPLPRPTVRARFADIVADPLRGEITSPASVARRRYDWLVVKTGGTTGHPTSVVHDAWGRDWGRATRLFSASQCGLGLGRPYFRLWGSESELLHTQSSLPLRVQEALLGAIQINAFRAREEDLRRHYETMRQNPHIHHLMAYVDAAVGLALYIRGAKLSPPPLETIMACAGTVTPEWRHILQETFRAELFDKYGSRDCGDMACECRAHRGLHVYSPNVFLEVVDDQGAGCPPGVTGRVLVTLLNNPSFPLIRYEIGDLAQWAQPGPCPCGLNWPRLECLQGRADDMLHTEDGTLLTSVFVRHFVGVSLNRQLIREWQLEQVEPRRCVFRYLPLGEDGLAANLAELAEAFRLALGRGMTVQMERVDEIPRSASGKQRWIINRVRSDAAPAAGARSTGT
jgi:phenylacetate-CoA ligase